MREREGKSGGAGAKVMLKKKPTINGRLCPSFIKKMKMEAWRRNAIFPEKMLQLFQKTAALHAQYHQQQPHFIFQTLAKTISTHLTRAYSKSVNQGDQPTFGGTAANKDEEEDPREEEEENERMRGQRRPRYMDRETYDYSEANFKQLNFDVYPYKIERNWEQDGKRMTFWANWRQLADIKRRRLLAEHGADRMRYKAMKTNNILPRAIIAEFQEKMDNMPRQSHPNLIISMCQFTGRRRGKFNKFRLNRHVFRQLADKGQLSGVQRGLW